MAELLNKVLLSDEIVFMSTASSTKTPSIDTPEQPNPQLALDEAYHQGFQKGFSEGLAEAHQKLNEQYQTLTHLLETIPEAISQSRLALSSDISNICLAIIQRLFIHQQQDKANLTNQIKQILTQLNHQDHLEIALHPRDIARLKEGSLTIDAKTCKNLRIIPDDTLRLGGCIIRSEHGVFNASIERQIDNLKQVLLKIASE